MLCELGCEELSTTPLPGLHRQHVILAETQQANMLHAMVNSVDCARALSGQTLFKAVQTATMRGRGLVCWVWVLVFLGYVSEGQVS
jgi:hypothetical protein